MAVAYPATETKWACPYCKRLNHAVHDNCQGCGAPQMKPSSDLSDKKREVRPESLRFPTQIQR